MNYVGQLAGQVFVTVKELYKGLNPATLSGCIDIIVIRQPNGNLQCSPFHVRFGKMGVLRSREKVVDIEINGESVDLHMKLGDNGEAFFVQETDNDQEVIPIHLATSPILSEGASRMECQLKRGSVDRMRGLDPGTPAQAIAPSETPSSSSVVKKRRKRRRKSQLDSLKRDDNMNTSEDEDMFPIEMSSDEAMELLESSRTLPNDIPPFQDDIPEENLSLAVIYPQSASYPNSDREWSPTPSSLVDCKRTTPHLAVAAEGGLSSSCPPQSSLFHPSESPSGSRPSTPKSDSELVSKSTDRTGQKNPEMLWLWGELPQAAKSSSPHKMKESSPLSSGKICDKSHFQAIHSESSDTFSDQSPIVVGGALLDQNKPQTEMQFVNEEDLETLGAAAPLLPMIEELKPPSASVVQTANKTDSPSRKKDKRSRHLGADGVYLDDLTDMDPEVAALYFPKNGDPSGLAKHASDNGARSANQSPQSVGSSGVDSGVESTSDGLRDLPSIAISLCGGLSDHREITKDAFLEQAVSYQQFVDNPAIIDDPNLVVKIGSKYYNWTTAAPLLLAMQAFQKPLPKATVESIMRDKMPKKGGRWWFSWRGRNTTIKEESKPEQCLAGKAHSTGEQPPQLSMATRVKHESSSSDEERAAAKPSNAGHLPLLPNISYKKTLRLTSEQLKSLKLKNGPNDVVFSVTTQYQGTCRCEGTIYLWNWDDKVIISDIDGTITRSDTLGHILPTLGKDWTHQGIAKLYHKVSQNGYKFLYCSARAIGMADMTRGYLHWVNERGTVLPQGPLLLSPSSLFSALHREVIEKKPEKFKVQCLTDIKNLFFPNTEPFYAAFGNRPADVYSYKQVGVSLNRIFTVNPKGELVQEHAKTNISSYVRLCEVVDHVFPLLKRSHSSDFPCSDTFSNFTFWREPLPPFENQDIHSASA
ncbi:phosphatidate phosphatase LPIN1 isoform X7 [Pongo abelii]|nr:phosphatidate phosphatase LPIN1 isoform X7 [Pongo abelii]XP_024097950.2 phosphatidate phosphatase LPIN1 isoform X7 [Pongo abelii]XP_024097952.2 phosphatidate phosphatase LPIN1 isoform X7 [Pongo abelii]XP_054404353.1 phosphatidate phosphatase LPIN1 isoform X7 [Pongo abelii]XP_054404354.1 phosphatidate phosphatase LPIN1 isoform X7 [Pongo abelii]XP_054404355.1 phosphatidate phosphatase LPIN1 isoform X7 [Pongo abelii]